MPYYRRCTDCGAYLDPNEKCDCEKETALDVHSIRSGGGESEVTSPTFPSIVSSV